jgi:hypothetical protein
MFILIKLLIRLKILLFNEKLAASYHNDLKYGVRSHTLMLQRKRANRILPRRVALTNTTKISIPNDKGFIELCH